MVKLLSAADKTAEPARFKLVAVDPHHRLLALRTNDMAGDHKL
jgi:hypothetical protein